MTKKQPYDETDPKEVRLRAALAPGFYAMALSLYVTNPNLSRRTIGAALVLATKASL